MSRRPLVLVMLACLLGAAEPEILAPGPVPAGDLGTVLPGGAMVHVQFDGLEQTIAALDDLIMAFVPEKLVPPPLRDLLTVEEPTLAFLGRMAMGVALGKGFVSRFSGIGGTGPVSFTLYPPHDGREPGWVLSLPVADFTSLTGILLNTFRARELRTIAIDTATAYRIEGRNRDLPHLATIICGQDRLYCCDSALTAKRILVAEGDRLQAVPAIGAALAAGRPGSVVVAVDFGFARSQVDLLAARYPKVPENLCDQFRRPVITAIRREPQIMLLFTMFGVNGSPENLVSQAEAWIQGAYQTLVPAAAQLVRDVDGFYLAAGIDGQTIDLKMVGIGQALTTADAPAGIPLVEVAKVLERLPPPNAVVTVSGRTAPPQRGTLWTQVLTKVREEHVARGVSTRLVDLLQTFDQQSQPVPAIEGLAPWTVRAASWLSTPEEQTRRPFGSDLLIQPGTVATVAGFYQDLTAVENANHGALRTLQTGLFGSDSWILAATRCATAAGEGGVTRISLERSYLSKTGLFGYSQHEFINRLIYAAKEQDGLVLVERVEGDGAGWTGPLPLGDQAVAPYWRRLLATVPKDAGQIQLVHALHVLPDLLAGVAAMEQGVHRELDAYLGQVQQAYDENRVDRRKLMAVLEGIPMPLLAAALHFHPEQNTFYVRLPLPLTYPRPAVAPAIQDLFQDVLPLVGKRGGVVSFLRAGDGRLEGGVTIDLSGAAMVVRGVGNRFVETYGEGRAGLDAFIASLRQPLDDRGPHGRVCINPFWAPMIQAMEGQKRW